MTPDPKPGPPTARLARPTTVPPPPPDAPRHLCPRCLTAVPLAKITTPDGETYWKCPADGCGMDTIPYRYVEKYDQFPPLPFALIGGTAQGKTRFLYALFGQLEKLEQEGDHWPGFFSDPLDTEQYDRLRAKLADYQGGHEERASDANDIPDPMIVRYTGIPRVGGCQLIYFDNSGEVFTKTAAEFRRTSGFLKRSPTLVWTVSLREKYLRPDDPDALADYPPHELLRILGNYQQAMATLGDSPKDHTLILTLTKGERLQVLPGFPDTAKRVLADDVFATPDPWATLEGVSDALTGWLLTTPYRGLITRLRSEFKAVRVCVVSAQGREYDPDEPPRPFEPKAVLSPLLWLWRADRPSVTVEQNGVSKVYLSAADAFAAVRPGAKVQLGRGEHVLDAPVKVHGPLAISGDGPEHTFLIGTGSRPGEEFVLGIGGTDDVRVSDVTVERRGPAGGDVVRVMSGRLTAERVRFRGGKEVDKDSPIGSGLVVGRGGTASARGCHFLDNARCGAWVFAARGDRIELTACTGRNNRHGLRVTGAGAVAADGCAWEQNRAYGVWVMEQGRLTAAGGSAAGNHKDGVRVGGDARMELTAFTATGNRGSGLVFCEAGGGRVVGGKFTTNTTGVQVGGQCQVQIDKAEVSDNRGDGLVFDEQSGGAVTGGTIAGNDGYGFALNGAVTVDCKDVRTAGNKSGHWKIAKTVPKLTRVVNCGTGRDDRPKGIFG